MSSLSKVTSSLTFIGAYEAEAALLRFVDLSEPLEVAAPRELLDPLEPLGPLEPRPRATLLWATSCCRTSSTSLRWRFRPPECTSMARASQWTTRAYEYRAFEEPSVLGLRLLWPASNTFSVFVDRTLAYVIARSGCNGSQHHSVGCCISSSFYSRIGGLSHLCANSC